MTANKRPRLNRLLSYSLPLAALVAATLATPGIADTHQTNDEAATSSSTDSDNANKASESPRPGELPRGHFAMPEEGDIIGQHYTVIVEDHEQTLIDIARRHNIGYEEIRMANPDVSLWVPGKGTEVVIPTQYILPPVPREGVVINLSELRLYYYPADNPDIVETYPVSVGRDEFATPVGVTRTTIKVKDPAWAPPASMRREAAERGDPPPEIVPPGPENPLGEHAILLDMPSYLIHGTNRPDGVGMRVSRGCIRMYPEDIKSMFEKIPSGTKVNLVDIPFKAGWAQDGTLFVQSFPQLEENMGNFEPLLNALERVSERISEKAQDEAGLDYAQIKKVIEQPDGRMIAVLGPQAPAPAADEPEWNNELMNEMELSKTPEMTADEA
ncbi:L,D-transpeptidase family protein [Halomonas sp. LS-001]